MITCPWCGTTHLTFQSNCSNCGGPLPAPDGASTPEAGDDLLTPPLAPRPIPNQYAWRLVFQTGGGIVGLVFGLLGFVFSVVGAGLTLAIITAFLGIPFLILGLAFLVIGAGLFLSRYQNALKVVHVLQEGQARRGQITAVEQNDHVRINGRYPWVIHYQFQLDGQLQAGQVSTLNPPGDKYQAGKAVWVLYLPEAPRWNSIYPHP